MGFASEQLRQHRGHRRLHSPALYGHQGGAHRRHYRNPHRATHGSHSLQGSRRHGRPQSHGRHPSPPDRHRHRPHSRRRAASECLDRKMGFDETMKLRGSWESCVRRRDFEGLLQLAEAPSRNLATAIAGADPACCWTVVGFRVDVLLRTFIHSRKLPNLVEKWPK